jgi:hypothetical protein
MPKYMLLLYAREPDPAEQAPRQAETPLWEPFNDSLAKLGLLGTMRESVARRPPRERFPAPSSHQRATPRS